jgi:hypothetical protein
MSSQSSMLEDLTAQFKLSGGGFGGRAALPSAARKPIAAPVDAGYASAPSVGGGNFGKY